MPAELESIEENQGILETIRKMRAAGVRRIPVVTRQKALVGIVSIDDLFSLLAEEMSALSKVIAREQLKEAHARR
jgi:predicted transcriptional regulator